MRRTAYVFAVFVYVCGWWLLPGGRAEKVLGHETDEFDFDGLPGAQHEFKVEVGAGMEECFYQKVVAGGKMHISFEVLRGGNMDIQMGLRKPVVGHMLQQTTIDVRGGFQYQCEETGLSAPPYWPNKPYARVFSSIYRYIQTVLKGADLSIDSTFRAPSMHVLDETRESPRATYNAFVEEEGAYAICLSNTFSRMASKLVYVYIVTYVEAEWEQYQKEIEEVSLTVHNFSASIQQVQNSLNDARNHQAQSRMHVIKDWYLISGNNTYIQRWSLAQCGVIIISTCFQVYFLRRLFRTTNVTPTAKPRA